MTTAPQFSLEARARQISHLGADASTPAEPAPLRNPLEPGPAVSPRPRESNF